MSGAEAIAQFLDQLADGADELFTIGSRLRKRADRDPTVPGHVGWIFDYDQILMGDPRLDDGGSPYGPLGAAGGKQYPPHIEDVDQEMLAFWDSLLAEVVHPFVAGRIADLLWLARHGDTPYRYAQTAIAEFIKGAEISLNKIADCESDPSPVLMLQPTNLLQRAAAIARETNNGDLGEDVAAAITRQLGFSLSLPHPKPGVVFGLIDAYETLGFAERPDVVGDSIKHVVDTTNDPWIVEAGYERLAAYATDNAERERLHRLIVERWQQVGDERADITRTVFYENAARAAQQYSLTEAYDEALRSLQNRPIRRDEMRVVSASVTIPQEQVDAWIEQLSAGDTWAASLESLANSGPLIRDQAEVEAEVAEERSGFRGVFPTAVTSDEGILITRIPAGESGNSHVVAQRHGMDVAYNSHFIAAALREILDRHGPPTHEELEFFFSSGATRDTAEAFGRGILHHLEASYDESVHIMYPRLERVLRVLARSMGLTTIRLPRGSNPGGVHTLGHVMADLCAVAVGDPVQHAWYSYFQIALVSPLGLNIRNKYAHGLADTASEQESAILIHIAIALRSMGTNP